MVTKLNPEVIAEGSITADKINIESLKTDSGVVTQDVLKTVNGQSIIGSGDITISSDANVQAVDTEDVLDDVNVEYATKTYVDDKVANISLTDYATVAYVNGLVGDINSVLESIINGGGGEASLITFTIGGLGGTEYQAEEGMTWEQWCDSEYNVENEPYGIWYVTGNKILDPQDRRIQGASPTSPIVADYNYSTYLD